MFLPTCFGYLILFFAISKFKFVMSVLIPLLSPALSVYVFICGFICSDTGLPYSSFVA